MEGQTAASLLPKLALLAGAQEPRGALLACSTAPVTSWSPELMLGQGVSGISALQWIFFGNLGVILTGVNPFLHRDLPETPSHCARRSTNLSPEQDPLHGLVGVDTACTQRGLAVSDECPVSCKAGLLHLCRAGWGLYFQLMLHPEEAARCRWSEIIGFLPALTPKLTSKCFLFSSNNFH